MPPDLISGALILFCGQSLVLATALFSSPTNLSANRCLAGALLVLAGMTSMYVFGWTGRVEVDPVLAFAPLNLPLALGPLLYGYVHGLVLGGLPRRAVLHLLPALLLLVYLTVALLLPADIRLGWKDGTHDKLIKPLIEAAALVSLAAYSLAGLRLLKVYRVWLGQARSDADRFGALWVGRVLLALLATLALLALVRAYTWFIGELDSAPLQMWLAAVGAFVGIQGWRHSDRVFPHIDSPPPQVTDSTRDWAALGRTWRDETQAHGWWREPDLTLADLARRLGTNTSYLSRAVNDGLGMNFNELINRMRAEEVARRIDAGEGGSLTQLALDAGFSSKATFNRAFRTVYGLSPSARRAADQIQDSSPRTGI
jgi:AraC-like DNA-binding protein